MGEDGIGDMTGLHVAPHSRQASKVSHTLWVPQCVWPELPGSFRSLGLQGHFFQKAGMCPAFPNSPGAHRIPLGSYMIPSFELRGQGQPLSSRMMLTYVHLPLVIPCQGCPCLYPGGDILGPTASSCLRLHPGPTVGLE